MERTSRRVAVFVCATLALVCLGVGGAGAAAVKVCPTGCAFSQIAPAIAAASPGDTIQVAAGTYDGGFTIDTSVKLLGAGAGSTIIRGGGPVITIGVAFAATEPTVTIDGVTVTGGVTLGNLSPNTARGGGIYIPRAAGPSTGATVTIRNSVIRDNRVAPSGAVDSVASAGGGGISNDGTLTVDHTLVTGNLVDPASGLTSEADGGGILDRAFGSLTLRDSVVTDNHAEVTPPNGQDVDTGGVLVNGPMLTIDSSLISNNSAQLTSVLANSVEPKADAGGVRVNGDDNCADPSAGCTVATIRHSTISGNSVTVSNSVGDAVAFCGGICDDGVLTLSDSVVSNNHVSASVPAGSTASASPGDGGIGAGGIETINDTQITGNTVTASAPSGNASAGNGGGSVGNGLSIRINDSLISGNHLTATTTTGTATVMGAGFSNGAALELRGTTISDNTGTASGPTGTARGGGIWNGAFGDGPLGQLTLIDSAIIRNTLSGDPGIAIQGGGLFTTVPVTLKDSTISSNVPDQCFGC